MESPKFFKENSKNGFSILTTGCHLDITHCPPARFIQSLHLSSCSHVGLGHLCIKQLNYSRASLVQTLVCDEAAKKGSRREQRENCRAKNWVEEQGEMEKAELCGSRVERAMMCWDKQSRIRIKSDAKEGKQKTVRTKDETGRERRRLKKLGKRSFKSAQRDTHTLSVRSLIVTTFNLCFPHSYLSIMCFWVTIFKHL